jgi:GTP pyrophosphokinase
MHAFAERGVAAHWVYKESAGQGSAMHNSIAALQRLLETQDSGSALLDAFRDGFLRDRVFVFTPAGEVVELPRGSTPLDFAYSIHTEVGHRCRGAKVDGRIAVLNHVLSSGEKVEILMAKQGRPSRDWLNSQTGFLRTARARAKVRQWFKKQDRQRNIQDGRVIVERELQRLGIHDRGLEELPGKFNLQALEDLYAEVGRGEISIAQIAGMLQVPGVSRTDGGAPPARRQGKIRGHGSGGIKIRGVGNLLTQIARCCHPMPGDAIVGYITRGKGITVHRADCANVLNLPEDHANRLIEVEWGDEAAVYEVQVRIEAYDRQGLLQDIVAILGKEKVNLLQANTTTHRVDQTVIMDLTLEISNTEQLSRLLTRIFQVPNVVLARRHVV